MPVPPYSFSTSEGWLTVSTAKATLRYKLGSGPFTTRNTSLQLSVDGRKSTVAPTWEWECTFGQVCQAGAATLGGGAALSQTFPGYESTAGYAGFFVKSGASVSWHVIGSRAGPAVVSLRYYNVASPPLAPTPSTLDLVVNGRLRQVIDAAPTTAAEPWATFTTTVPLVSGTNSIKVVSTTPNSFDLGLDTLAVGPGGSPPPTPTATGPLGGWFRGFDTDTYNDAPTLRAGTVRRHVPSRSFSRSTPTGCWTRPVGVCSTTPRARCGPRMGGSSRAPRAATSRTGTSSSTEHDYSGRLAHPGPTHRPRSPASPQRLRCVVLGLHAVFEQHHRELGLSGVRRQPRAPQHPVARHRLEGAQRLERLGVEPLALSLPLVLRRTGRAPTAST